MKIDGTYRVYKNNKLILTSPNLITDLGKSIILQYLSGGLGEWASYISLGAYNTAASVSDYKMYYEITRTEILSKSALESVTTSISGSGTLGSSSITVSSSVGSGIGYAVSGAGISSSATVTVTGISGTKLILSHPIESTFSGSALLVKSAKSIKFRSRLPKGIACSIYELGMFNSNRGIVNNNFEQKILSNFDEGVSTFGWSSGSSVVALTGSYTGRLSESLLKISPVPSSSFVTTLGNYNSSSTVQIGSINSNYGNLSIDTIPFSSSYDVGKILVYSHGTGASISVVGQDTTTEKTNNYITIIQETVVPAGGPWIIETPIIKQSGYNDILSKIEIRARVNSGSPNLYLDSLKFSYLDTPSIYSGLVSRSVLSTPITKTSQEVIEIEYEVFLFP